MWQAVPRPNSAPAEVTYAVPWLLTVPFPLRNMLRRWRGMLGMIVGVGIALSIVMTLLAIGRASIDIYTGDFRKSSAELYVTQQGGTLIPILPGDSPGTIKQARRVLNQIRALPDVGAAVGVISWSLERERPGPRRRDTPRELMGTLGIDGEPADVPNMLNMKEGRWLRRTDEVVVGTKVAREKGLALGDTLRLSGRDFTIVGIGRLRGFGFGGDSLAYLDYRALRERADLADVIAIIAVDTRRPAETRERIVELGLGGSGTALAVNDVPMLVQQAEAASASSVAFYWILSTLALVVGGLFVSNVLARSVAERRLEFATMRAIGLPTRTILLTVAYEALLVSVAAGAAGIGQSLVHGWLIDTLWAPTFGIESLYSADAGLFLLVIGLALTLGVGAGLFPARNATRVDPVEVLREA